MISRILIVDDNPAIHEDFKRIFQQKVSSSPKLKSLEDDLFGDDNSDPSDTVQVNSTEGNEHIFQYEIDCAHQGQDAVDMVKMSKEKGAPYNLIFVDVRMPPGIDGVETAKKIWEISPETEIVICSAYSDYSWDDLLDHLGIQHNLLFVRKPFESISIKQTALSITQKSHLATKNREHQETLEAEVQRQTGELAKSVAALNSIFDATGEAIFAIDNSGFLVRYNGLSQSIFELPDDPLSISGINVRDLFNKVTIDSQLINHELQALESDPFKSLSGIMALKGEQLYEYHSIPQLSKERLIGRVWCLRNVTKIKENEDLVKHQAYHDALTDLPNRLLLLDKINQAIVDNQRRSGSFAVLFIDLDDFKKVNDTGGHQMGDLLLVEAVNRIRSCKRDTDTLARIGGDEFIVLLEAVNSHEIARHTSERIIEVLKEPFLFDDNVFHISASIGISIYPNDDSEPEELIRKADLAMYHAKNKGRSTLEFFSEPLERIANYNLELENRLRLAIKHSELSVYYQPLVDTENSKIVKMEALSRWFPEEDRSISTEQFIPLANRTGLIREIDYRVLEIVCRQIRSWRDQGIADVSVSINLTSHQFADSQFIDRVKKALESTGIPPSSLELEITETMLVEKLEEVRSTLEHFRSMGMKITVDDYGTGYSSLKYLHSLPIDQIKVNRVFIGQLFESARAQSVVKAIISLCHKLNFNVIAEGVEDSATHGYLKTLQCDYLQGFLFYYPMPAEKMTSLLLESGMSGVAKQG